MKVSFPTLDVFVVVGLGGVAHGIGSLALNRGGQGWIADLLRSLIHLTRIVDHIDVELIKPE